MSTGWTLFFLAASYMLAGYMIRWVQKELGWGVNWPHRERCRRFVETSPTLPSAYRRQCENRFWRLRLSSLAPLSGVCRECRRADERNTA